jgi:prepilin-type N-terminal cleavage/methylation domain-containing protein
MTATRRSSRRSGVSLVELLVAMTLLGIIGLSILRTFTSQARLTDLQAKRLEGRAVSRAPVNLFMSEARMVETGSGVVAASASAVTLRIPVAMGLVCGTSGASTVLSLLPVDSAVYASAAISGHAWRQVSGVYSYNEATTTVSSGGAATCAAAAASITTVTGGTTVQVTPQMAAADIGAVAFLYQRVKSEFKTSTAIAGRVGLWRTLEQSGATEELAAPFDAASRFRYYSLDADTVDTGIPTLNQIRGIRVDLLGSSERNRFGKSSPETARLQTAVFFTNRIN